MFISVLLQTVVFSISDAASEAHALLVVVEDHST
jgi:hypothetical protein